MKIARERIDFKREIAERIAAASTARPEGIVLLAQRTDNIGQSLQRAQQLLGNGGLQHGPACDQRALDSCKKAQGKTGARRKYARKEKQRQAQQGKRQTKSPFVPETPARAAEREALPRARCHASPGDGTARPGLTPADPPPG